MLIGLFNGFPHLFHDASGSWILLRGFQPLWVFGSFCPPNVRSTFLQSHPVMWFNTNCQKPYLHQSTSHACIRFLDLFPNWYNALYYRIHRFILCSYHNTNRRVLVTMIWYNRDERSSILVVRFRNSFSSSFLGPHLFCSPSLSFTPYFFTSNVKVDEQCFLVATTWPQVSFAVVFEGLFFSQ